MQISLQTEERKSILLVRVKGQVYDPQRREKFLEILQECEQKNLKLLLIDGRASIPHIELEDNHDLPDFVIEKALNKLQKIAIVHLAHHERRLRYLCLALTNRGLESEFFTDLDEGIKWLEE